MKKLARLREIGLWRLRGNELDFKNLEHEHDHTRVRSCNPKMGWFGTLGVLSVESDKQKREKQLILESCP